MSNTSELLADRLAAGSALYDPQDRKLAVAALRAFASPPSDVDIAKIGRDSANRIMALRHTPPSDVGGRSDMAMLADDVVREMYSVLPTQWDRDCLRAKVLYALRQSAPSPGQQDEQEAIARIIEPTAYHLRDELAKEESNGFPDRQGAEVLAGKQVDIAIAKADAILSILSRSPASDDLHPVRSTLRKIESDLRSCVTALGEGDDLGAVLTGYADAAKAVLARSPAPVNGAAMRDIPPDDTDRSYLILGRLKSCAHCSGTPVTINRVNEETGIFRGLVSCSKCSSQVGYNAKSKDDARQGAVDRWQKRALAAVEQAPGGGERSDAK